MTKRILLVTASETDAEVLGTCVDELAKALGIEVYRDRAKHQREAEVRLGQAPYNLIISDVDIPEDGSSVVREKKRSGLSLLTGLRNRRVRVPVILLGSLYEREVARQLAPIACAEYVNREGSDWENWLAEACKKYLVAQTSEPKALRLEVDIVLHPADKYQWRLNVVGLPGGGLEGALALDREELSRLSLESEELGKSEHWEQHLRNIGENLFKQIFESNFKFAREFYSNVGKIGDRKNVWIRFVVARDMHPIVLEALKEVGEDERYWMLSTPIYRRVTELTDRYALYQDAETRDGPINCIIIQADIESKVTIPKFNLELEHLGNVKDEVEWLRIHLDKLKKEQPHLVGEVAVVDRAGTHGTFTDAVREALQGGKWHIVHYAGHSYFDPAAKAGHVFFPGGPGGKVEDRRAEEFANWLATCDARFVFLSSCHSSEEDFVFELANAHVPAVMGFRWDIADKLAEEYTECFYTELFEKKSLEYAFLEARTQMHAKERETQIWASPMLVIQAKRDN